MGEKKKKEKKEGGKKDGKKKKHRDDKKKGHKDGLILNSHGDWVPAAQYAIEQTLDATTKSLTGVRERMNGLITTNEELQENFTQQEKDALEVIAALHAESQRKDNEIQTIREEMRNALERAKLDRLAIIEEAENKIAEMNSILNEKDAAFKVMQSEFAVIKDFRVAFVSLKALFFNNPHQKKRQDMLKDLEYQKEELADTQRQHKETVTRMERKFFEEKIRLQKDANRKISELAAKAHQARTIIVDFEAMFNLNETTKEIYKENLRMADSLKHHVQESEELTKQNKALLEANRQLMEEKDLHNVIVKEKVLQVKQQAQEIKELNLKIESMEHSLSHVVREFEHEREIIGKLARKELNEVRKVTVKLRENLEIKTYEMKHIKRLAQHILDQRTRLEKFFMDALDHVRKQIQKEAEASKKAAHAEYNHKIREVYFFVVIMDSLKTYQSISQVMSKKVPFPPVQSFRPNVTPQVNKFKLNAAAVATQIMKSPPSPVPKYMAAAAEETGPDGQKSIDIHDLSWSDKERVLRLLFAKMNGVGLGVENEVDQQQNGGVDEEFDYDPRIYPTEGVKKGENEFVNVVEVGLVEPPTEEQFKLFAENLQSINSALEDTQTQGQQGLPMEYGEGETGFALTTAYTGSRRNLLPHSENKLTVIQSGETPMTNITRAGSLSSS
ncbi:hypothetical protein HDU84_004796 [Entophlyctis sp. JEL0112]|nr:hypothetical protein HDU84_004796 [Entophlyctis sp. JEL0112]